MLNLKFFFPASVMLQESNKMCLCLYKYSRGRPNSFPACSSPPLWADICWGDLCLRAWLVVFWFVCLGILLCLFVQDIQDFEVLFEVPYENRTELVWKVTLYYLNIQKIIQVSELYRQRCRSFDFYSALHQSYIWPLCTQISNSGKSLEQPVVSDIKLFPHPRQNSVWAVCHP